MKNPDLTAIKQELAHGDMTKIAERVGVSPKTVSEFFTYGWHRQHTNKILNCAAELIQDANPDDEVTEIFEDLGLTSNVSLFPAKKRRPAQSEDGVLPWWALIIAAVIAILVFFPGVLSGIIAKFKGGSGTLTMTEAQQKIYDDYLAKVK